MDGKEFQLLLVQYQECIGLIKDYASNIWQLLSLTIAINTFLGIMYLGYAKTSWERLMALSIALLFTIVSKVQFEKHRFFSEARLADLKYIQDRLRIEFPNSREIKFATEEIFDDMQRYPHVKRKWVRKQKAFDWFGVVLDILLIAIVLLVLFEIVSIFYIVVVIPR